MHELSICQNLLDQVASVAQQYNASSVTQITLRIGPLSGVEPGLLLQAFPLASAGTIAQDAALVVESQPIRVYCSKCHKEGDTAINQLICPYCGDHRTRVISGDELLLVNLELSSKQIGEQHV